MEEDRHKKQKTLQTRLRLSFGPSLPQSHVPLDIWKHILQTTDLESMSCMAQTSKAFEEVVREKIRTNNLALARRYKKEGQIRLALWCLRSCVDHGNSEAMFDLGYAHMYGGWGAKRDTPAGNKYFGMAQDLGNERALVMNCWQFIRLGASYNDPFARGYFSIYSGVGNEEEQFADFQMSAHQGDEYGQYYLGLCYMGGTGTEINTDEGIKWIAKSAEQGFYEAQRELETIYQRNINLMEIEHLGGSDWLAENLGLDLLSKKWGKKANAQDFTLELLK